jgi:N12 class adenine-specific DNA methylase
MEKLTGHSSRQLQRELDSLIYRNPQAEWETADCYLSGDVRAKLKTAEAAATIDPSYRRNVEALKEVQPVDLLPGDISSRLGSSWIPASDVKKFVADLLDISEGAITVSHSGATATWALTLESYANPTSAIPRPGERHGQLPPT